ncbi:hypothetical protein FLJC2902T_15800 [Flavobacterium limnosediminis JC2902]|uniref:Probable membrane transporter protein n=1 Tax=Flavobacterium limnosediminis JC2902 TaxID=1341181 RepID=V6SNG7_9FLAO|nr:sulfite exporter TauE/SafE family protein [Flavobacterium limnosediminis]ESU28233.1 hypothetical protein FLJC2902T_15800 [Flavobacterium limnosediminis JC2902]
MDILIIALAALLGSALTFFSGFGLGTILLPVFAVFFPVEIAIALTAIVHLLNNFFKLLLIGKKADKGIVIRFGIPAVLFSFLGAMLLKQISHLSALYSYEAWGNTYTVTPIKVCIAVLLFFFAMMELIPKLKHLEFSKKYIPLGGMLSGFFGGLSGHQGALRSAFLIRAGLSKEAFIATGIVIACGIDIVRLTVYSTDKYQLDKSNYKLLFIAVFMAFSGAYLGNKFLKKITIETIQIIVGLLLVVYSVLMGMSIL